MERDRYPGFPGFRMYHEFFAGLGGAFEPVICTEGEKRRLLCGIRGLVGHPTHEFRLLREDLELTARIREARRYDANRLFVRFEFRRMEPNCTWSRPLQMMALFDEHLQLTGHCILCGKCVTRDFARAEALLTEAVEACPDRKDFAADLERARNGENL